MKIKASNEKRYQNIILLSTSSSFGGGYRESNMPASFQVKCHKTNSTSTYFTEPKLRVEVEHNFTSDHDVILGVPQGYVLRPLI